MKRKIISTLFAVVLVLTLGLVTAVPVGVSAAEGDVVLVDFGPTSGDPILEGTISHDGSNLNFSVTVLEQDAADDDYLAFWIDPDYLNKDLSGMSSQFDSPWNEHNKILMLNFYNDNTVPKWGDGTGGNCPWGQTDPLPSGVSLTYTDTDDGMNWEGTIPFSVLGLRPGDTFGYMFSARIKTDAKYVDGYPETVYGYTPGWDLRDYTTATIPPPPTEVWVDDDFTEATSDWGETHFATIQDGINAVAEDGTVSVAAGTYIENVTINKTLILLSTSGREDTTIQGDTALGNELGTVFVTNNTDGVQIGDIGQGFTIIGIDGPPGLEKAAVYFQGGHSNAVIKGNDIVANGDAGLLTEWGATITGFVISNNEFSGKTFVGDTPGGEGFGQQFTDPNVPRQLANMGGGSGGGNTADITFTDNHITGTAGGINSENSPQGNTLVTIDSAGSMITGNVFEGTTTRYGTSLRARGPNATIGNDFKSTGLTLSNGHLDLENNPVDSVLISANTFDKGVYVENASGGTIGLSIQGFVSFVPEGTTINVLPGTYTESINISVPGLTLQAASSPVLEGSITVADGADDVTIDGFRIEGEVCRFGGRGM